jgi:hypothetical protein
VITTVLPSLVITTVLCVLPLQNYQSGVFNGGTCGSDIDHGVLLTGYQVGPNRAGKTAGSYNMKVRVRVCVCVCVACARVAFVLTGLALVLGRTRGENGVTAATCTSSTKTA